MVHAALDHLDEGISVFDAELRLVTCNRRFLELLDFPPELGRVGSHFSDFIRYNAERGEYGPGDVETQVAERCSRAAEFRSHIFERTRPGGTVIEIRGNPIAGGGFVTVYSDVTERRRAEVSLRASHNRLEKLNRELSETLRQLQTDEEAGKQIQFQLLPEGDQVYSDYHFDRLLLPSAYLSGDFVDYFPIDDHWAGFYMADVSGHSIASAVVTVMLKSFVSQYREALSRQGDDTLLKPAKTLDRLNHCLLGQLIDKHVTMFYGAINLHEHRMVYSNGGQFPYPILHDGAQARALGYGSRPVGLFDDSDYQQRELDLPRDFLLLLVSDGILEVLPQPSVTAKYDALCAQVVDTGLTLGRLSARLGLTPERRFPDDITFLSVSRRG